jgi:hypothetical protein
MPKSPPIASTASPVSQSIDHVHAKKFSLAFASTYTCVRLRASVQIWKLPISLKGRLVLRWLEGTRVINRACMSRAKHGYSAPGFNCLWSFSASSTTDLSDLDASVILKLVYGSAV